MPFDRIGTSLSIGVAVIVALINTALSMTIARLTRFERQKSHSARARSQCAKMAVAQYLNTSITPLIASAEIKWLAVVFGGVVFERGFPDFTTNWYAAHAKHCNIADHLPHSAMYSLPCSCHEASPHFVQHVEILVPWNLGIMIPCSQVCHSGRGCHTVTGVGGARAAHYRLGVWLSAACLLSMDSSCAHTGAVHVLCFVTLFNQEMQYDLTQIVLWITLFHSGNLITPHHATLRS